MEAGGRLDAPKSLSFGWTRQLVLAHLTWSLAFIQDCMRGHIQVHVELDKDKD